MGGPDEGGHYVGAIWVPDADGAPPPDPPAPFVAPPAQPALPPTLPPPLSPTLPSLDSFESVAPAEIEHAPFIQPLPPPAPRYVPPPFVRTGTSSGTPKQVWIVVAVVVCWFAFIGITAVSRKLSQSSTDSNPFVDAMALPNLATTPDVVSLAAGGNDACLVRSTGTVECWGEHSGPTFDGRPTPATFPTDVVGVGGAIAVGVGPSGKCAVLAGGAVTCWANSVAASSLMRGVTVQPQHSDAHGIPGVTGATAVAVGDGHACALIAGGGVMCWGANEYGQLGIGATVSLPTGVQVAGITNATEVTSGAKHTCALLANGGVACWGDNSAGQLGRPNGGMALTPALVPGITGATSVSAGDRTTCAVIAGGAVVCWGLNHYDSFGNVGATGSTITPVIGVSQAVSVSMGGSQGCALLQDHSIRCWGNAGVGHIANKNRIDFGGSSTAIRGPIDSVHLLASGDRHTCGFIARLGSYCWGPNEAGQDGLGYFDEEPAFNPYHERVLH